MSPNWIEDTLINLLVVCLVISSVRRVPVVRIVSSLLSRVAACKSAPSTIGLICSRRIIIHIAIISILLSSGVVGSLTLCIIAICRVSLNSSLLVEALVSVPWLTDSHRFEIEAV